MNRRTEISPGPSENQVHEKVEAETGVSGYEYSIVVVSQDLFEAVEKIHENMWLGSMHIRN